jgi:hypothetical protein
MMNAEQNLLQNNVIFWFLWKEGERRKILCARVWEKFLWVRKFFGKYEIYENSSSVPALFASWNR